MKYTIEGFDQKQLISYSLDACDALILRWFIDFSVSGKMKKTIRGRKIFYLVRYQSIIDDLPILGIENPRNIGRRFDKFVSCGLLEKEIIREGTGTQTIFCPTDKVNALSYKENNVLKVSESTIRENTTVPENTVMDSRQYSKVPSDGTQKYGALNKFFYQNSSTTATENLNLKNNQSDKTHNIAAVVSKLKINFEKYINCSIFSDDFWQNLASVLIDYGLAEKISEYTQFLFENLGKVGNAANYIYKTAGSHYRIQQFINTLSIANSKKQENEQKQKHFCVVCTEPFWGDVCPCCGFQNKNSYNEQLVEQARYKYKFG
ncbi:MAG: hypothetical protein IAA16_06870 [Candidatus Treponema excrementipullorum]|uniref:Uncharacterized protein n=1 Tax=Candidatus Treponema excrementipullorum TaxID=2838768 RepID=A0A9E2L404_9SPIR|nr:hypothetical protein [Candidatus Treponema excrementipullorum]